MDWKDIFRRQVTEGITVRSKFVLLGEWSVPRAEIIPCISGFLLSTSQEGTTYIKLIDTVGKLTTVFTLEKSIFYPVIRNSADELFVRKDNEFINFDTGERRSFDPREIDGMYLGRIRKLFAYPDRISPYTKVTQFLSKPGRNIIVKDHLEKKYYIVCFETRTKELLDLPLSEIHSFHYYRDVLYTIRLWFELIARLANRRLYPCQIVFSGMHSVMTVMRTGLVFFYNLESKVFTLLDVTTGKTYSQEEFSRLSPESFSRVRYEFYFTTVCGVLYILAQKEDTFRLISHQFL